jgi:short-subunit dehydrogenase
MINGNINSQTFLTHFMLPRFLKRATKSAIIDMSSISYKEPVGIVSVYSATKSYDYNLSKAVQETYPEKIDVLTVTPGAISTNMNPGSCSFCVEAPAHAKYVLSHLGKYKRTRGHWIHALQSIFVSIWYIGVLTNNINLRRY